MNNEILLIGNSGLKHHGIDGQTAKVRLYSKKIQDEGFRVNFIDLEGFTKAPFSTLLKIKKGIKKCNRIVLLSASRGCKILIPFINKCNKKHHKPFVLPLIGTSVLHHSIDKLSERDRISFFVDGNYSLCKPHKKMAKELSKITYILPETDLLVKVFKEFYKLDNVFLLNNFREAVLDSTDKKPSDTFNLIYLSRVMEIKGIFDILGVVKEINSEGYNIKLDIYGKRILNSEEEKLFNSYVDGQNILYFGEIDKTLVFRVIAEHNLFVFPTRYLGEGTPGVIAESLLAGTPILTSDFPQVKYLLEDGKNAVFYKMFDKNDLKNKLKNLIKNKEILAELEKNAMLSGKKYTYEYERVNFLRYVCGAEVK